LQSYFAPPDAQSLEFSVLISPAPTLVVPSPTAAPPIILPETEIITTPEAPGTPEPDTGPQATLEPTPEATPLPTLTPTPLPTLDPTSLMPGRLVIPAIGLDAPVVEVGWDAKEVDGQMVSSWIVPDFFAAGWHKTSALPGHSGNVVLNGHHNIHGEVFRDLEDLEPGNEIIVYTGEAVHHYGVVARHILEEKGQSVEVRTQNAQWVMPTEHEQLTLVTCWPYTSNTHRLVVVALPMHAAPAPMPME
jgi:sortase A